MILIVGIFVWFAGRSALFFVLAGEVGQWAGEEGVGDAWDFLAGRIRLQSGNS
jgi:hypothetical protein